MYMYFLIYSRRDKEIWKGQTRPIWATFIGIDAHRAERIEIIGTENYIPVNVYI